MNDRIQCASAGPASLATHASHHASTTALCPWLMLAALLTVGVAANEEGKQGCMCKQPHVGPCSSKARRHASTTTSSHSHRGHQLWTAHSGPHAPRANRTAKCPVPPRLANCGAVHACNQKYRRQISSSTDLRFLHIPREMADNLIPDVMAYQVARPGRKKAQFCLDGSGRPVFAARLSLVDDDGRAWPVMFRTYVTGKQYHRRLTAGWGSFASHHSLTAGDAVHFWRRAEDECEDALVMRVQVVRGILR